MKKQSWNLCFLALGAWMIGLSSTTLAKEYHVAKTGSDTNEGSVSMPFLSISEAVNHAMPMLKLWDLV